MIRQTKTENGLVRGIEAADHYEMSFTKDGAAGGDTEHARMRFLLDHVE